jgi:hypothetical protein
MVGFDVGGVERAGSVIGELTNSSLFHTTFSVA